MTAMRVDHFMTRDPVACDADATVQGAASLMRRHQVGFLVVLHDGEVVGVLTDRQLALEVLGGGLPHTTKVRAVMTHNPATVTLDDNLYSVLDTLRSAGVVRRVPVLDHAGALVGVVSISDLAVVATDLIDAVLLEDTHHALKEVRLPTGGKRLRKEMRSPTAERAASRGGEALRSVDVPERGRS